MQVRNLLIILTLILSAGCQSQLRLMPTPELLKDERFNLFEINPQPLQSNEITTLYVTTRVPVDGSSKMFAGRSDDSLHFGYAELRIGEENLNLFELIDQSTTGERTEKFGWSLLDAPLLSSTGRPADADADGRQLPEELAGFIAELNRYIDQQPIKELTIYAHGANNTFYHSIAQGAQFQYFTGDNAMVLTFAWPSPGNIWSYGKDKRRSNRAATDLAYVIELLAHHSSATRINLLAYSAGGRVIGRALEQLSERYSDWEELKIGQVYLTQSDQPLNEFARALPRFFPLVEGLTVTAASGDPVLTMARITDTKLRLGATGEGDGKKLKLEEGQWQQIVDILNSDHMVYIDLKNVPAEEYHFSHGVWYESPWVSTDVMTTLLGSYSAQERGLEPVRVGDATAWVFPPDYIERLTESILSRTAANREVQVEGR